MGCACCGATCGDLDEVSIELAGLRLEWTADTGWFCSDPDADCVFVQVSGGGIGGRIRLSPGCVYTLLGFFSFGEQLEVVVELGSRQTPLQTVSPLPTCVIDPDTGEPRLRGLVGVHIGNWDSGDIARRSWEFTNRTDLVDLPIESGQFQLTYDGLGFPGGEAADRSDCVGVTEPWKGSPPVITMRLRGDPP
jgi:hypothetical protein